MDLAIIDRKLYLIEQGRQVLAEAKSVPEAKEIRDQAAAIEHYLKQQNGASDAALLAAELKLMAERRLGELLEKTVNHSGTAGKGRPKRGSTAKPLNGVADLGITKTQSHRWQQVASVPEQEFQEHIEQAKADKDRGELTTTAVLRIAKEQQREARREANRELVEKSVPASKIEGPFPTIVIDPPWNWDDEGDVDHFGRGKPTYDTMPFDQVKALPVSDLADKNAHLYLWITNRSLPKGFELLEVWGFRYITCLTWCKPSIGMGNYFRGSTEQILFGVRGSLSLLRSDVGTWFQAGRPGKHSGKPEEFYQLVESCSPGAWLEMFARKPRSGWVAWGAEV